MLKFSILVNCIIYHFSETRLITPIHFTGLDIALNLGALAEHVISNGTDSPDTVMIFSKRKWPVKFNYRKFQG